jgi:hypothetical protein
MNLKHSKTGRLGCLIVLAIVVEAMATVNPPFFDGFEGLASNTSLSTVSGWAASGVTVSVQPSNAIPVAAGTNAVILPVGTAASNLVQADTPTAVWIDFQVNEALHMLDGIPVDVNSNAIVQLYMKTNGAVTVYDKTAGQWLSYSNDVWGNPVASFYAGGWARVSVLEDYTAHKAAVFLNGHLLRTQLDFITNRNVCAGFTLQGNSDNPVYLDEVQVQTNVPAGLTNDVDLDGMADAQEIQTYGNETTWRRWTNTVSATAGGTVTPGAGTTTYTNGTVVTYVFQGSPGNGISAVQTNGVSLNYTGNAKTGTFSWVISTDGTFAVSFAAKSQWLVPADIGTISGAVAVAVSGDTVVASNGLTTAETIVVDKAVTMTGSNVTVNGTLTLNAGVTSTLANASGWVITTTQVGSGGALIVSNGNVTMTSIAISASGVVRVYNSTVTANGVTLTGSFTLDSTFGAAGISSSHLNFWDDFELYALNTRVDALRMFGWGASAAGVVVQSNTTCLASGRAVMLPAISTLTNTISSTGYSNVWTSCALNESNGMMAAVSALDIDTNAIVQLYMNTNGYVVLYSRLLGQWQVCSNDVLGASLDGVYSNGWAYISVNQNYATKKVAVFLNGHLVRQEFDFINTNQGSYVSFRVSGSDRGAMYMDNVGFSTNVPTSLTNWPASDLDHDGIADAVEIAQYGSATLYPRGSVFKIR